MNDITHQLGTLYHAVSALVIYQNTGNNPRFYVEAYDMDDRGYPINAHPLSVKEGTELAKALDTSGELQRNFLKPKGLMPDNILHIDPVHPGYAIWHTPGESVDLVFKKELGIPNGQAFVPSLIWKASPNRLYLYAVKSNGDLTAATPLYHAPFFNMYEDGNVCMGSVKADFGKEEGLETFMNDWQACFWNSYFSHLIMSQSPVKENIVRLWQDLLKTQKRFPAKVLKKNNLTLQNIIR